MEEVKDKFTVDGEEEYEKGLIYLNGSATEIKDWRKALRYFKEAAQKGHKEAIFQVGFLYMYGEPMIMRNTKYASDCFKEAADSGIGIAQFYFSVCCLSGCGIDKNETMAFEYCLKSANQNIFQAMDMISEMYLYGVGTEKDLNKAEYYNNCVRGKGNTNSEIRFVKIMMERSNKIE